MHATYTLSDRYYTQQDDEIAEGEGEFWLVLDRELVGAKIPTKSVYEWVVATCPAQDIADGIAQALNLCQELSSATKHISDLMKA
jgi:hypothetical protein